MKECGLSTKEAEKRRQIYGENRLEEGKKESLLVRFFKEFADPMTLILLGAAGVSGVTAFARGESFADVVIILAVVVINAGLGVAQESKAEAAIGALQEMTAVTSLALRDGNIVRLKSEELVFGDVVFLEAGDAIPADGRLLESVSLKAEESALTGESVAVEKQEEDLVYMGSNVVYGRGQAVITAIGMDTEMGKIARMLAESPKEETPLQKRLGELGKILTVLVIVICGIIFAVGLWRESQGAAGITGEGILDTFMTAVSLAVAAIPEGLAAVVTIVLSVGVTNMSKRNAIVRRLTAVETLGCTEVICSDKTGTLTQNKMQVAQCRGDDSSLLKKAMALCNDARMDEKGEISGEPTECALVRDGADAGFLKPDLEKEYPRVGEAPFDSGRKLMSTVHRRASDGSIVQFTKGAPDVLLARCGWVWSQGKIHPMTRELREKIAGENREMAGSALRVLGAAMRNWEKLPEKYEPETLEQNLIYLGLSGMMDPVRPEAKEAIRACRRAGIRPVMITGDHRDTAAAIGKELGIIENDRQVLTGAQLDKLDEHTFLENIGNYSVYARVQPEHKVRIVKGWKANGKVTAMTGDGVNDAPSIKCADIGIGMGITGTDVTKNVADMVLADDNFATIVSAVEEGRRIYANIRKAIQFLLASNLAEVLSVFFAALMGFVILKPVHLLWINLITDCFPALALGFEESEPDSMERPPRNSSEGIFAGGMAADVLFQGLLVTVLVVISYVTGHYMETGVWEFTDSRDGITMAFLTLSMVEIFHSLNMRSRRESLFHLKKQNPFLNGAMVLSLVLTTAVIQVPGLAAAFDFTPISLKEYLTALGFAVLIIPAVEAVKWAQRRKT